MATPDLSRTAAAKAGAAEPVAPGTLQRIRDLIVHGRLAPGTRIIEAELARRLGVSRTPVREALYRLQRDGYIVGGSGRSRLTVAPLTQSDSRELYQIVGHLEGLAARRAAELSGERRTTLVGDLRRLNQALQRLAHAANGEQPGFLELDMAFHQRIVEAAAGTRLRAICAAVKPQVERYWRLYASVMADDLEPSAHEHRRIITAIEQGDADAAERWARENWRNGAERLARIIATHGEHGDW